MKKITAYSFILVLMIFSSGGGKAIARSKPTLESLAIANVWKAMRLYEDTHEGRAATNWHQIHEVFNLDLINRDLRTSSAYPIDEHYTFLTDKIPVPGTEMGDVVLIRISPVKEGEGEEGREGRYIISKHDGVLKSTWLAETNVQKMLADAGVTELPKPEPLNQITNATGAVPVRDLPPALTTNSARIPQIEPVTVEPASAPQGTEPTSSAVAQTSPASPAPSAGSASFLKMFVVPLVAILGLAAAFILFRSRK